MFSAYRWLVRATKAAIPQTYPLRNLLEDPEQNGQAGGTDMRGAQRTGMGGGGVRRRWRRLQQMLAAGLDTQGLPQCQGYRLKLLDRYSVVSDMGEEKE